MLHNCPTYIAKFTADKKLYLFTRKGVNLLAELN